MRHRRDNWHREQAKRLLRHYFELARPGISAGDGGVELDELIDAVVDAAVVEMQSEFVNVPTPAAEAR